MALRLVEAVLPAAAENIARDFLKGHHVDILPSIILSEDRVLMRMILEAEEAEPIIDYFTDGSNDLRTFRLNVIALEATLPEHRPSEEVEKKKVKEEKAPTDAKQIELPPPPSNALESKSEPKAPNSSNSARIPVEKSKDESRSEKKPVKKRSRISVDELVSDLSDSVKLNLTYLALIALSVVVAAVGFVQNNVAVIIGAMVIAPLLAPNMALSLATTLASGKLALKALKVLIVGILLALTLSYILGVFIDIDPTLPEIASRVNVRPGDIAVALAAGAAAAIFVSLGIGAGLVGVTVAVAILPPLVVTGLLAGAGELDLASNSLLLLICNLIGINLASTMVFVAEGVWPRSWWEERKAKRAAIIALLIWTILLVVLILLVLFAQGLLHEPGLIPFPWFEI